MMLSEAQGEIDDAHGRKAIVLLLDLTRFFDSAAFVRLLDLLEASGYPRQLAKVGLLICMGPRFVATAGSEAEGAIKPRCGMLAGDAQRMCFARVYIAGVMQILRERWGNSRPIVFVDDLRVKFTCGRGQVTQMIRDAADACETVCSWFEQVNFIISPKSRCLATNCNIKRLMARALVRRGVDKVAYAAVAKDLGGGEHYGEQEANNAGCEGAAPTRRKEGDGAQ